MKTLDMLFWAFCGAVTLFMVWQFLTLIVETIRTDWGGRRRPKAARHAASGGLGGDTAAAVSLGGATSDSTDSGGSDSSSDSSGGGDFSSGGGDYGGGGSSGSWS